ncbi:hypothetical protein NECAME_03040 [Necator americanus]|uniref:Uncharacterized protein n=1 Tax=Necator americanus TaxID=51031 RepID=W2T7N2_NECAM|nr:hypothetical protein NECAME_03040 [Necator americanus]ETN77868.1 hypothetical protein NECAME_03040 [Necator americanus]
MGTTAYVVGYGQLIAVKESPLGLIVTSSAISSVQWIGVALFFTCNRQQHLIAKDIAALRKAPDVSAYIRSGKPAVRCTNYPPLVSTDIQNISTRRMRKQSRTELIIAEKIDFLIGYRVQLERESERETKPGGMNHGPWQAA